MSSKPSSLALIALVAVALLGCGGGAESSTQTNAPRVDKFNSTVALIKSLATESAYPNISKLPPKITISSGISNISTGVMFAWNSGAFFYSGNIEQAGQTYPDHLFGRFKSVSYSITEKTSSHSDIEFITSSPQVEVVTKGVGSSGDMTFIVNDELVSETAITSPPDGNFYYTKIDFGYSENRKVRIRSNSPCFMGVITQNGYSIEKPDYKEKSLRVIFIGDSITEGPAGQNANSSYAPIAALMLGWRDAWVSGVGATGYISAPSPKLNFIQRFDSDIKPYNPDVIVIAGGINDSGYSDDEIKTAAGRFFDKIQSELPDVAVFVLGPWNPRSAIRPGVNSAIKSAAAGRKHFLWVPNYDDSWITGTGYVGHPAGDGNSDIYTSSDGTHPSTDGIFYLATRFATSIKKIVTAP